MPKEAFATRIENSHGGGVPDVHVVWDGMPFWAELKVSKSNALRITPHQVAWHMAYYARGGLSFFLVKSLSSRLVFLFEGDQGPALARGGLIAGKGSRFESVGSMIEALGSRLVDHYRDRWR